jgi:hypothetical protein
MSSGITNYVITRTIYATNSGLEASYPIDYWRWNQIPTCLPPPITNGTFNISAAAFANGVALIPTNDVPLYGTYDLSIQAQGSDGKLGGSVDCWGPTVNPMFHTYGTVPFIDGTTQMKNNLGFLMANGWTPFDCGAFSTNLNYYSEGFSGEVYANPGIVSYPLDYVYSSFFTDHGAYDQFLPFEDNCIYSNFLFNASFGTVSHPAPDNSAFGDEINIDQVTPFPTYAYASSGSASPISPSLIVSDSQWFSCADFYFNSLPLCGIYQSGSTLYMTNGAYDVYGLPYLSFQLEMPSGPYTTLSPGQPVAMSFSLDPSAYYAGGVATPYSRIAPPALQTVGYYFARLASFGASTVNPYYGSSGASPYFSATTVADPMPGNGDQAYFDNTNTTPLMLTSVGKPLYIAGYAKQVATNALTNVDGYSGEDEADVLVTNVFAYLGQYFTNALLMSNGTNTTNIAGIVSEYGSFFPTMPGQIALMTKPDPDQGNLQGDCIINVIRLSLDVNHDGVMDETFTGPDNTSAEQPFSFWVNNNFDRWTYSVLDGWVEDDVQQSFNYPTPDCSFTNSSGQRAITCPRDLEDFARLWVSGISSNVLAALPSGSTVTLSWQNNSGVTIDLFQAADTNGGIGYLTNLVVASNQLAPSLYVERLGPGQSIQLNASTFSNNWAGNHFIWCGVAPGSDQLNLTIADGSGNVLAQSSQYIQLQDVKQMYERWTVGDSAPLGPMNIAVPAADNFTPGYAATTFQYPSGVDTNDDYILFVHGYNMESWEKDRFAETAYKRLYWQGYQGRFGSFRWPTYTHFWDYDVSESQAWNSGIGLERQLLSLNAKYPGNVYVLAHSMGNVVTGEALRLAGTNELVNTYVASQAAVSARAYDSTNVPADLTNSFLHLVTPDSEGHYYTNGMPPYFYGIGGASHFVDFYNPVDWALGKWQTDQNLKPDVSSGYGYTMPSIDFPFGYNVSTSPLTDRALIFTNDTYAIFSRCVQSYSFALGAETNIANTFSIRLPVNLQATPYSFRSDHPGHSQQFRFDNMTTAIYWKQLLSSFTIP